ncbi:MAG: M48 family metalloprotease, partial [Actinobacteria bacterium]|nr:M48 family metalloprotease [Actinomycetota bacterium]
MLGAPGWVTLYAVTLAIQAVCAYVCYRIASIVFPLALDIIGQPNAPVAHVASLLVAYTPLALSLVSLAYPVGAGRRWRRVEWGRAPTDSERAAFDLALAALRERDPRARAPRVWFVTDRGELNGAVLGDTMMLTSATLEDPRVLPAILAHELGHLNMIDGNLTVALNRLKLYAINFHRHAPDEAPSVLAALVIWIAWIASGDFGLMLTGPLWDTWFRSREHLADDYAARLGQAQ